MTKEDAYHLVEQNVALYQRLRYGLWLPVDHPQRDRLHRILVRITERGARRLVKWVDLGATVLASGEIG